MTTLGKKKKRRFSCVIAGSTCTCVRREGTKSLSFRSLDSMIVRVLCTSTNKCRYCLYLSLYICVNVTFIYFFLVKKLSFHEKKIEIFMSEYSKWYNFSTFLHRAVWPCNVPTQKLWKFIIRYYKKAHLLAVTFFKEIDSLFQVHKN